MKKRLSQLLLTALLSAPALLALADEPDRLAEPAPIEPTQTERNYSPHAVMVDGPTPFGVMTFEDVGLDLSDERSAAVYEAVAETVALQLGARTQGRYSGATRYVPDLSDPRHHLFCDQHHLYVALWRGQSPHRWGYSLWSGCGQHDRFAWNEVEAPFGTEQPLIDAVAPLAAAIVDSLVEADSTRCYRLRC